ncbi:sensor histidine kinase [Xylanibacter oryzae]|uniref:sensor histidine kinase n=1 Tax=Xylanibacter oryzae TaxID=185293 RepID=UPI0004B8FD87|nr:HAMP domain-containing sensor histidine kinase [Xylanibacter oryzae]
MKIGHKIVLFYTCLTFGIAMFIIMVFYVFTSRYIDRVFEANLCEKAYLAAQKHFKADEMNADEYKVIERKYSELLPRASETVMRINGNRKALDDTLNLYLSENEQKEIYNGEPINFSKGVMDGAVLYCPDNQGKFIIIVMAHNKYGYKIQQHTLYLSLILLIISIAITVLMGHLYSGRILRPLKQILEHLKGIRGNDMDVRLKDTGNKDELDGLVHNLNDMLDRISEAFRSEKSFVSAASHELSNPLTAIQGECEITLMKERNQDEYIESLQRIYSESKRMSLLIKHLLFLSRHDDDLTQQESTTIKLNGFLQGLAQSTERVVFSDESKSDVMLDANPYLLQVAIQNFLNNATKYSKKQIDLRLKQTVDKIIIEIEDYGIGIPESEVEHIFQSFYRATNTREYAGNGIGLALSAKILRIYNAEINIDTIEKVHTKFTISFDKG